MKIEKGEFKLAGGRIGMEIAVNEEMIHAHAVIDTTVLDWDLHPHHHSLLCRLQAA